MSRLGAWTPVGLEERLDRMESLAAIRQLPYRCGLAVDSRDMASLAALFAPLTARPLPESFPTWAPYWAQADA